MSDLPQPCIECAAIHCLNCPVYKLAFVSVAEPADPLPHVNDILPPAGVSYEADEDPERWDGLS